MQVESRSQLQQKLAMAGILRNKSQILSIALIMSFRHPKGYGIDNNVDTSLALTRNDQNGRVTIDLGKLYVIRSVRLLGSENFPNEAGFMKASEFRFKFLILMAALLCMTIIHIRHAISWRKAELNGPNDIKISFLGDFVLDLFCFET